MAARLLLDAHPFEVRRGDVLFGNRLSPLQRVMVLSGDPWTHSALVGRVDGDLRTIEMGAHGCFSRTVEEFSAAYRFVGHARLDMGPACVAAVAARAERELAAGRLRYSWPACALLESVALARRISPASWEERIVRWGVRAASAHTRRASPDAVTCSGFVARCLAAACEACRPTLAWPARDRVAPWRGGATATDVRPGSASTAASSPAVLELLSTPSDLWVAACLGVRSVVRPGLTTVLVDLTGRAGRRRPCTGHPPGHDQEGGDP